MLKALRSNPPADEIRWLWQKPIERYFLSDLYRQRDHQCLDSQACPNERYSWTKVGEITKRLHGRMLENDCAPSLLGELTKLIF